MILEERIKDGDLEFVENFYIRGKDIDQQFEGGVTGLILACQYQNLEIVKLLLSMGANPKIEDDKGFDAEKVAFWYGEGPNGYINRRCKLIVNELRSSKYT